MGWKMKLTIIKDDGVVGVNGVFKKLDISTLPSGIRAVQWDGATGHIEFYTGPNQDISDIAQFQPFIDDYNIPDPPPQIPILTIDQQRALMIVSRFQARAAMLNAGILPQLETYFASATPTALQKEAWNSVSDFRRLSPLVVSVGALMNLSDVQLDLLFSTAATIKI